MHRRQYSKRPPGITAAHKRQTTVLEQCERFAALAAPQSSPEMRAGLAGRKRPPRRRCNVCRSDWRFYRHPRPRLPGQHGSRLRGIHRAAEEEALEQIATHFIQRMKLFLGLNTFRNDPNVE